MLLFLRRVAPTSLFGVIIVFNGWQTVAIIILINLTIVLFPCELCETCKWWWCTLVGVCTVRVCLCVCAVYVWVLLVLLGLVCDLNVLSVCIVCVCVICVCLCVRISCRAGSSRICVSSMRAGQRVPSEPNAGQTMSVCPLSCGRGAAGTAGRSGGCSSPRGTDREGLWARKATTLRPSFSWRRHFTEPTWSAL